MLAAIAMTVLGFALSSYAPRLAPFASVIAAALFVAVLVSGYRRRSRPRYEKRWRGQIIEFPHKKKTPWKQLTYEIVLFWRSFRRRFGGSE